MPPKKQKVRGESSSRGRVTYDRSKFMSAEAENRYGLLKNKAVLEDRGIDYCQNPVSNVDF